MGAEMTKDEALKLALEALQWNWGGEPLPTLELQAINAIKEVLAQPEQEPVAWTPVATAMPKSGVVVLACYKNSADKVRRIRSQWIAAKTQEANDEFEDWSEYDEEADTYWTPEGWYECIDNWDEYSSVFVHEQITHWMPLPADPYTTPPHRTWVGLTEEEIGEIEGVEMKYIGTGEYVIDGEYEFAKAIEAKLREKNRC